MAEFIWSLTLRPYAVAVEPLYGDMSSPEPSIGSGKACVTVILHRLFHRRLHDHIVTAGAATEIVLRRSTRHWRRRGVQFSVTAQRRLQRRRMGRRGWLRRRRRCGKT